MARGARDSPAAGGRATGRVQRRYGLAFMPPDVQQRSADLFAGRAPSFGDKAGYDDDALRDQATTGASGAQRRADELVNAAREAREAAEAARRRAAEAAEATAAASAAAADAVTADAAGYDTTYLAATGSLRAKTGLPRRFSGLSWQPQRALEHPLYQTSAADIGARVPSVHELPLRWHGIKGEFSAAPAPSNAYKTAPLNSTKPAASFVYERPMHGPSSLHHR